MLSFYFCVQITLGYCIELHTFKIKLLKWAEHWQIRQLYCKVKYSIMFYFCLCTAHHSL